MNYGWLCLIGLLTLPAAAQPKALDCEQAFNTLEINQCAAITLAEAEDIMQTYLQASLDRHLEDPEVVATLLLAQERWQDYAQAHCDAIYSQWRGGTIRTLMALSCKTELVQARTHQLWRDYLTYMDSTPSEWPEPQR